MEKTITLKVSGMACGGCEKRVENALLAVPGVFSAKADRLQGTVVIQTRGFVLFMDLVGAVEQYTRYHVLGSV